MKMCPQSIKILLLILGPASLFWVADSAAIDPITELLIDSTIRSYFLEERHIPGFGLSIVQDGEIVHSKGYGWRNVSGNSPTTNATLFGLGSVTKAIVSTMAIKYLMEKFPELGGGVIDTPIQRLAPDFNFTFIDRYREENINFRDLFSHRHCLAQSSLALTVGSIPTSEEFAYRQRYIGQTGAFRSGCFSYSNDIYGFAGEALAQVMNRTFSEMAVTFMREIGMTDAIVIDEDGAYESNPNLNQGYYWDDSTQTNSPFNVSLWRKIHVAQGAGGIFASPRDLGAYLAFHLNRGRVADVQVMTPDQLNIQYAVAERLGFGGDKNSQTDQVTGHLGYGLGVTVSLMDGWLMYQHAGNFHPFRNKISFSHKQNLAVYTTSNSMRINEGDMDFAHLMIAELFRRNSSTPGYANIPGEILTKMRRKEIGFPSSDWDLDVSPFKIPAVDSNRLFLASRRINETAVVGVYGHNVHGNVVIYSERDGASNSTQLWIKYGTDMLGTLAPVVIGGNVYTVNLATDMLVQYWADGGVREITFTLEFLEEEEVINLFINGGHLSGFKKNELLDSAPAFPWAPDSCSPE